MLQNACKVNHYEGKIRKNAGEGAQPPPPLGRGTPIPNGGGAVPPPPSAPRYSRYSAPPYSRLRRSPPAEQISQIEPSIGITCCWFYTADWRDFKKSRTLEHKIYNQLPWQLGTVHCDRVLRKEQTNSKPAHVKHAQKQKQPAQTYSSNGYANT